ncbi:MAG: GNAT family N-acetyltransferase [Actinomycetota bacterium]
MAAIGSLQGTHVRLRAIEDSDIGPLGKMLEDPGVAQWWHDYDEQRLRIDLNDPQTTPFAIESEGKLAGFIWFYEENEPEYRHAGIDISVGSQWQNKGIGTDALRTLSRYLFDVLKHHRIIIDPAVANSRAVHVYEKVGFRPVGVMRRYERLGEDSFRDGLMMDLLPEDLSQG